MRPADSYAQIYFNTFVSDLPEVYLQQFHSSDTNDKDLLGNHLSSGWYTLEPCSHLPFKKKSINKAKRE